MKLIESHTSYTATFRMLAQKHKQINHLAGGDDDIHFVRCVLSKHPMLAASDISEFLKSMRTRLKFPAMVLVSYSTGYGQNSNDAKRKKIEGEFFILDRVTRDDWNGIEQVLESSEEIGEDILGYLVDYYDEHPEDGLFKYDEGINEKFAGSEIDNLAGTKFYFTIDIPNQAGIAFDETKFNDLTIE